VETPAYDATPSRLTRSPSWLLTQTAVHAGRLVADGMVAAGARGYHYRVLASLDEFGPASQAGLSRHTGIHVSDLVATVTELTDQKLVKRTLDPADRRRNIVSITPAGRRQLHWLDERMAEVQEKLLAPLAPADRQRLTRLLTTLLEHHNRAVSPSGR
jgi:DNA-binding MarR family transcriptional regulator